MATGERKSVDDDGLRAQSFEVLFGALEAPLLRYARHLVCNNDTAEEIVQEAFFRLHDESNQVRDPRSWLFRTVHNLAVNYKRKSAKTVSLDRNNDGALPAQPIMTEAGFPPDEELLRLEGIGLVRLGLERLDRRSREVLMLKFYDGLSYKEISQRTGLTVGHVGYLLHHALKALAVELTKAGLVP